MGGKLVSALLQVLHFITCENKGRRQVSLDSVTAFLYTTQYFTVNITAAEISNICFT